jgi:hypothetical protein
MIGHPLTMLFDPFESIVLFFSVLTVNYVVQDGKSNWLEGMILMCLYVLTFPLTVASVFSFGADTRCVGTQVYHYSVGLLVLPWNAAGWAPHLLGAKRLTDSSASPACCCAPFMPTPPIRSPSLEDQRV